MFNNENRCVLSGDRSIYSNRKQPTMGTEPANGPVPNGWDAQQDLDQNGKCIDVHELEMHKTYKAGKCSFLTFGSNS